MSDAVDYSTIAAGPREGWWMVWAFADTAKGLINPGWLPTKEEAEARLRDLMGHFGGCGIICQSVGVTEVHKDDCDLVAEFSGGPTWDTSQTNTAPTPETTEATLGETLEWHAATEAAIELRKLLDLADKPLRYFTSRLSETKQRDPGGDQ